MKFEYMSMETLSTPASLDQLNGCGADGWELVTIIQWGGTTEYYFKRECKSVQN